VFVGYVTPFEGTASAERTLVAERPRGMRLTRKGKWVPDDGIRVR
jgi:hypothetical protein